MPYSGEIHSQADERFRAYVDVLSAHGYSIDEECVVIGDYTMASGERAMKELLARNKVFDAVVVANDSMALGALQVLRAVGIKIPESVSVTEVLTTLKTPDIVIHR